MRRLSIIDLEGSDQPISTRDGRYWIVFNGEIYNYKALRTELAAFGYVFQTAGDTEVILASWLRWREEAWAKLDGMFAVAIWDSHRRELTLCRDPIGIKPLYYSYQNQALTFGSELKAVIEVPGLALDPDPRAIHDYFSFGHVRAPRSIYQQVKVLDPGCSLKMSENGEPVVTRYWTAKYKPVDRRRPIEDWVSEFQKVWLETVESQMLTSDVAVGAFLSGGVDSSAVVAAMSRLSSQPVKTFTIGFAEKRFDESAYAEAVASHLGCDHRTHILDPDDARDILPTIQATYDEPFADPSAIPTFYLSRIAAQEVKVALSGDGGDELFFGYKRHLTERQIGRLPRFARTAMRTFADLPPLPWSVGNKRYQLWQKTARSAGLSDGGTRFFAKTQITSPEMRQKLFAGTRLEGRDGKDAISLLASEYFPDMSAISNNSLEQFAMGDLQINLPSAMLTKVDRASMANSLEVRVPMLGRSVVDLALSMPADAKLHQGVGKYPVRKAIESWLPKGVLDRRKQGFQIPLSDWFKKDLGQYVKALWTESDIASSGFLNASAVDNIFEEHRVGTRDHGRFLYALAIFCLWWSRRSRA